MMIVLPVKLSVKKKQLYQERVEQRSLLWYCSKRFHPLLQRGSNCDKLKKAGCIGEFGFYRSMTSKETMDLVKTGFKEFGNIDEIEYLQASRDNCLQAVHQELDACGVIKLAGSGSLYVHQLCASGSSRNAGSEASSSQSLSGVSSKDTDVSQGSGTDSKKQRLIDRADEIQEITGTKYVLVNCLSLPFLWYI